MGERERMVAALRRSGSVFAEDELTELHRAAPDEAALAAMVARRAAGEPIEQIVGTAAFAGLRIRVRPGVFVPRRRTELLATIVADALAGLPRGARLLDLGCGSGAIAALAMHRVPGLEVVAIDADPRAVDCARENLTAARVVLADSPDALDASARFDVVAANLPYVPTRELALMPRDAREHEPLLALDGGPDGLVPLRRLAPSIAARLAPGGRVAVELAPQQVDAAAGILRAVGLGGAEVREDDALGATVLVAR
ncbi:N5-glutamine methyltransferase family protein [Agrococcus sp. DT81.2]|uniref:N5-glutamine methyltransferase family protein n=1 Tax=Agrococcus sp. DT81.2 TaxID=3393414 RepID=UPI003CE5720A